MTAAFTANLNKIGQMNDSDIEFAVLFGLVQLIDGIEFLSKWTITKVQINSEKSGADIWFELDDLVAHRAIEF